MTITHDLAYIEAARRNLKEYVLSETLYYPLGGDVQLGIGAMREALWRLDVLAGAGALTAAQAAELGALQQALADERHSYKAAYDDKAGREFRSRIDTLGWYLDDPTGGAAGYAAQARSRLRLELLKADVTQPKSQLARLEVIDRRMREMVSDAPYVLEPETERGVSRSQWWWLFSTLKPRRRF